MMKVTAIFGALGLMSIVAAAGLAQRVDPAKVKINGVGLDSTYSQVLKALGKPTVDGKPRREGCIGGRERTMEYDGLTIYLMDGDSRNGKTFEVKTMVVRSPKWNVSGVRVGDTAAAVRLKYGRKYSTGEDPESMGDAAWTYDMGDEFGPGSTIVVFKRGKVIAISTAFMVC